MSAPNDGPRDTADSDMKDFDAALKEGRIKPSDSAKATHKEARDAIAANSALPAEFESEFADYHRGARAYQNKQWDEARKAWENLLSRPDQDRHYRTVWAAFMLGKIGLKTSDFPTAVQWFERTREFAKSGFADSLGLAADSYGWEGRAEWKQQHPEKAAPLFLTQLTLGDPSAIVSLKAVIPDREPTEGLVNYGPEPDTTSTPSEDQKRAENQEAIAKLKVLAKDPLLRRLETAHILATAPSPDSSSLAESGPAPVNRCARWLTIIKEANIRQVEDAEYLGWIAYENADYKGAAHWLELSKGDSPAAFWLRAKLQRRAGKLADAANNMARAVELLKSSPAYSPKGTSDERSNVYEIYPEGPEWGFGQSASGDLGGLRLARGDFVQAFDALFKGKLWEDAAFMAERILTANELKQYVDSLPPTEKPKEGQDYNAKLRYLLGRRLVREDRYTEANQYLSPPYGKVLERYVKALQDGANEKLSKTERAHAWFSAAWIARYDGMELMGTEFAPDGFSQEGEFEIPDLAQERRAGVYEKVSYSRTGDQKTTKAPLVLKPTPKEIQRLSANKITPDIRFHYRLIAGALAMKAAALLPDNSEELADVVNQAGMWVKDRDEKTANRYYEVIDHRCAKTQIGRNDMTKHWFLDQEGPWSKAERQASRIFDKEIGRESSTEPEPSPEPEASPE